MDIHKLSYYSSSVSFGIGSLIFLLFQITGLHDLAGVGILFILGAAVVNGLIFLVLMTEMMKVESNKRKCTVSSVMLLINIPIAIVYFNVIVEGVLM
jgi:hypothetical protein